MHLSLCIYDCKYYYLLTRFFKRTKNGIFTRFEHNPY